MYYFFIVYITFIYSDFRSSVSLMNLSEKKLERSILLIRCFGVISYAQFLYENICTLGVKSMFSHNKRMKQVLCNEDTKIIKQQKFVYILSLFKHTKWKRTKNTVDWVKSHTYVLIPQNIDFFLLIDYFR